MVSLDSRVASPVKYGQKGGQTGQSQPEDPKSGQQNQKKGGGQGQNEEDDKTGQRRAS